MSTDDESEHLLRAAKSGDREAIDTMLERYRGRLRRMVEIRLNRKLWGRVDPSDVVQEAMLQAAKHVDDYVQAPKIPPYLWLRSLTQQQLLAVHRFHLGTEKRDASLEVAFGVGHAGVSSASLASLLVEDALSPSKLAENIEQSHILEQLIEELSPIDREILALRHFEQLTNVEVAELLQIGETAASQRFIRALKRLRQKMREMGFDDG